MKKKKDASQKKNDPSQKKKLSAELERIPEYRWTAEILCGFVNYSYSNGDYNNCIQSSNSVAEILQVFLECSGAIGAYEEAVVRNRRAVGGSLAGLGKGLKELREFNKDLNDGMVLLSKRYSEI